jgi:hypothetical protein
MTARPPLLLLLLVASVSACGGKEKSKVLCNPPTAELTAMAVEPYVKGLDPVPARFMVTEGTDSSLDAVGRDALQKVGPVRILPPLKEDQDKVRDALKKGGSWTTLLLSGGTYKLVDDSTAAVSLRGTYLWFGDKAGQAAPAKDILFACRDYNWVRKEVPTGASSTSRGVSDSNRVLSAAEAREIVLALHSTRDLDIASLADSGYTSVYEAVSKLRPEWIRALELKTRPIIMRNDAPASLDDLMNTRVEDTKEVKYIEGHVAVAKWGEEAKGGLITVTMK